MSDIMRPRYGTKAENDGYIGLDGEISIDRETQHLRIHNGVTAGGAKVVANQDEVEAVRATAEAALPKTGGTMTGGVTFGNYGQIRGAGGANATGFSVFGTPDNLKGSLLTLSTANNENHEFFLQAGDGTNIKRLLGKLDGTLSWDGKDVITSAGGTFTGDTLRFAPSAAHIAKQDASGSLRIDGGTTFSDGAFLAVHGKDATSYTGCFQFRAGNGTSQADLVGRPNGSVTWAGKEVERVNSIGAKYIRLESGLQIVWGYWTISGGSAYLDVTLPVAFKDANYIPVATHLTDNTPSLAVGAKARSSTVVRISRKYASGGGYGDANSIQVVAIGFWK